MPKKISLSLLGLVMYFVSFSQNPCSDYTTWTTNMWIGPGSYCAGFDVFPYGGEIVEYNGILYTHKGYCSNAGPGHWDFKETGTCDAVLPIELLSFTAIPTLNNSIQLNWQTATEVNNDFFTIERCITIPNWEEISRIDGAGNSSIYIKYNTIDNNPFIGTSYYRLKQTDYDGTTSYSQIVSVNLDKITDFEVYPSPAVDKLNFKGCPKNASYVLTNSIGQKITLNIEVVNTRAVLDVTVFEKGFYILEVITSFGVETRKIVIE